VRVSSSEEVSPPGIVRFAMSAHVVAGNFRLPYMETVS